MTRADTFPELKTALSEGPSPSNRLGVRSGGEGGTTPALAAVVNAIVDALSELGMSHIEMPGTPERVWRAIQAARGWLIHRAVWLAPPLSPIVENVEPWAAVTWLVRSMHRDTLDHRPEAASHHLPIRFLAREIHSGQDIRHAGFTRERSAGAEQRAEPLLGARSRPHRSEFRKAAALPGFARRAPVADGKAGEPTVLAPQ